MVDSVGRPDIARRLSLADSARSLASSGDVAGAWQVCSELAAAARAAGDVAALADAALVMRSAPDPVIRARLHALALEAMARASELDSERAGRVRAQVAATRDPFHPLGGYPDPEDLQDPEAAILILQGRIGALQNPAHVQERLTLAGRAVGLGLHTGEAEYEAWGRRWRMDAYAELGHRVDLAAELAAVAPLTDRLGAEWRSWRVLVTASGALLEGRFEDASRLVDEARRIGGSGSASDYFHLIYASNVARLTGASLGDVLAEVRRAISGMPYLAKGWLAAMLHASGEREEAQQVWRAIRGHVARMPTDAPEWLVASVSCADVCRWLGDAETAVVLYQQLLPHDGRHAIGLAHGPYEGPVSLALGRLAATAGRTEAARRHLEEAIASAEEQQALPHAALAHAELAKVFGARTRGRTEHVEASLDLARRLGMQPLRAELEAWSASPARAPGLTPRESEVAQLVSEGLTNGAIAKRLTLSERTVENHVAHVLHKLALETRTALAVWARDQASTTSGGTDE